MPGEDDNILDEILDGDITDEEIDSVDNEDVDPDADPMDNWFDLGDDEDGEDDSDDEDEDSETESDKEDETEDEEPEMEDEDESEDEPKKKQTPEENAKFREQRKQRQQELEDRIRQETEQKLRQESPEFQVMQRLSQMYGVTPDQLMTQIQQAEVQQFAQQNNLPVEMAQRLFQAEQKAQQAESNVANLQFQMWKQRVSLEGSQIKQEFPYLSDADMMAAENYLLQTIRNPDMPLREAVMAVHHAKIISEMQKAANTEALAKASGRKKSLVPPQGGQAPEGDFEPLTAEERQVAKAFGMTEKEYAKSKRR